ncbi:MAG: hypothetical protein IAE87_15075 [Rhodobacteraceae bacterium]|jgi:hypothetical protein|nr:hypothetical protein [Paracoccaceae bacterium]
MFRSVKEFEETASPTAAERHLIASVRAGELCLLCDPEAPELPAAASEANRIRAALLRLLILGATPACGLHERGVVLVGGWIAGRLDLAFCAARGQTCFEFCHFEEEPSFYQAHLRLLSLESSAFPGLLAPGVRIDSELYLSRAVSTGTVSLAGAWIGGQFGCWDALLNGESEQALAGRGMQIVRGLYLDRVIATGTIALPGARIDGQFSVRGAGLNGNGGLSLNANSAKIGQGAFFEGVTTIGMVDLAGAQVKGELSLEDATLDGGTSAAGFPLAALQAAKLEVAGSLVFRHLIPPKGRINLTAAHAEDLVDDPRYWPTDPQCLVLNGFTYDRISGDAPTSFSARRRWLEIGSAPWPGDFHPQPYSQLARVLREMGHAAEARRVLLERERQLARHRLAADRGEYRRALEGGPMERGDAGWIWLRMTAARAGSWVIDRATGFGYAPERALYLSLGIVALAFLFYTFLWRMGAMVPSDAVILTSQEWAAAFARDPRAPALSWPAAGDLAPAASHYETFYAAAFALDVYLPLVDLGQQSSWSATTASWAGWIARLLTWLVQGLGYVITSLGLAAATGVIQRNNPD